MHYSLVCCCISVGCCCFAGHNFGRGGVAWMLLLRFGAVVLICSRKVFRHDSNDFAYNTNFAYVKPTW